MQATESYNVGDAVPDGRIVAWRPIPNSSQSLALDTRCDETLFTGTRGPGKTDTQLARFRRLVGIGYGSFWKGVIFDQEYKSLDDIVSKSHRMFSSFGDGAKFKASKSDYKWVWPTGEELLFREFKDFKTYSKYHGQEFPYIGWNELTKWPTADCYDMMLSCNRSSFVPELHPQYDGKGNVYFLPRMPLEIFSTTNSSGPGHNWVKRRFINHGYGKVVRHTDTVFNPRTKQDEEVTRTQVAIFGTWKENIYLDVKYIQGLMAQSDPMLKRSWLLGDWDIVIGGAFDDLWKRRVHVLPKFRVPKGWKIDRAFDWGSSHPFYCGWFAEADGTEALIFDPQTGMLRRFCPPKGSLILCGEWYGTQEIGTNKGLKMSARNVAIGIKDYEIENMQTGHFQTQPEAGPADNQIRDVVEAESDTIEKKMQSEGIRWTVSDKSPGSRRNGMQIIRDALEGSLTGEGPGFYIMDHCLAAIEIFPGLQRDKKKPDDVDTTQEDHPYDVIRYRWLSNPHRPIKSANFQF